MTNAAPATETRAGSLTRLLGPGGTRPAWWPVWSKPAAMRAVRATLVVPGLFALCYFVIADLQMALFASFGGFATLVLASFGGGRRDKLLAHLGLAVVGSVLVIIGTAAHASAIIATLVTIPVAFAVLFAGILGPNAASAGTAALLAYVLPAASPGTMSLVPSRLEGWLMVSAAGTLAVLLFSPPPPGARLRKAAADTARTMAEQLEASLRGDSAEKHHQATVQAKYRLLTTFTETPYRPTGLATADQALESLVGLLEWCAVVICESLREYRTLSGIAAVERELLAETGAVLTNMAALLDGKPARADLDRLERSLAASVEYLRRLRSDRDDYGEAVHLSYHARTAAVTVHTAMADALIVAHRADPEIVSGSRKRWYGAFLRDTPDASFSERRLAGLAAVTSAVSRRASLRSVWFRSSVRAAVALAAAVAVAQFSGVQSGFWVVLGTLSVLRGNAAATGATALRAMLGTVVGFIIGAGLLLAIGDGSVALWAALPVAVLIASYAPGALPFAAGQAAFTVLVSVLFNLLAPIGWQIAVVRIEDVALGCAVSVVVGVLFWPRGAASVVADDLADSLRAGGSYLVDAANWALGLRHDSPSPSAAIATASRLDDALRGFLTEQGSKKVPKEDLWRLVAGTVRTRLTAHSLAGLPNPHVEPDQFRAMLSEQAAQLAAWYDHLASRLDRTDHRGLPMLAPPRFRDPIEEGVPTRELSCALWVSEHLKHIAPRLGELVEPAQAIAAERRRPWWR